MSANEKQVAGNHYRSSIQHWDYVVANDLDYFQAQITKYVTRWKKKNGLVDLEKAKHFLEKYIELQQPKEHLDKSDIIQELNSMAREVTGIPDHLKEVAEETERQKVVAEKFADLRKKQQESLSPMLKKYLEDNGEPLPNGYVNQD